MSEERDRERLPDRVEPDEARELVAGGAVRVIDVRGADDFAAERISGSVHVGEDELEGGVEADRAGREAVLVVCADGERSAEIAERMRSDGTDATSIEGGFEAWAGDGQPTAPGRDEEYDGPAVTVPGAVDSSGGEDEDDDGSEEAAT
jgi:rhodanese-related sulfurtransferase